MPYTHFFSALSANILGWISGGGYVSLFVLTFLEGIPLVGMAIPGHLAIIIAGFLARIEVLSLPIVLIVSVLGAVLGDFIGFTIGKKYGLTFIDRFRPYFFITDAHIAKARALLSKHTGKSMIIGRFTPATRALMPFIVGTTDIHVSRFWFFNVIGGVSWAIISVMAGYFLGSAYHLASRYFGRIVLIAIPAICIIIWGYRFVNMRFHIFKRYELFTLTLNVLSLFALAMTIETLVERSFKLGFDVWVNLFMDKINHAWPFIVTCADYLSRFGGLWPALLSIYFGVHLLVQNKWRSGTILLLSFGLNTFLTGEMKAFFMSPRPLNALQLIANSPSFPSGHSSTAAAFFVVIIYLLAPKIHSWVKRELMIVLCVLTVILIGLSRLVLNVHWASDVIGGWALGIFVATSTILFVRYVGALVIKKEYK